MASRALSARERMLILAGIAVFFSVVTVPFARGLARDYRENRQALHEATARLRDVGQLRQILEEERAAREQIVERMGRGDRFSLYDYAQTELTRAGLGDRMRLEKRGAANQYVEVVSISLSGVGLKELTDFLHRTYSAGRPIALQQLDFLRPARDGKGLDCSMTLMSPRL